MSRYRKFAVALGGAAVQVVGVLATADEAGVLPAGWRPWVAVVVALATALGVRQVPNAAPRPAAFTDRP